MARNSYYVTRQSGQWFIVYNEQRYGPYATQADAISAARGWAINNQPSQVLIQNAQSQWRAEWTYGNDPYPPRG